MVSFGGTGASAGGSKGGHFAQQLLSLLAQGPTGSLLQQYILPLTNFSSVSAAQLPLLLQGTNFTTLSTAAVLDAAGGRLDSQQKWQLANLHQKLFCAAGLTQDARRLPNSVLVPQGNFSIYVYKDNDIVSQHLAGESHSYEKPEVEAVLWALRQYKPKKQHGFGAAASLMSGPLMVDVGANVGTFLFKVADAGYRVAAFEGMPTNIALLRHSLCVNPRLAERVALFGTGLGSATDSCAIISDHINVGDGHTVCGADEIKRRTTDTGYTVRGEMSIRRLDSIIAEDIQVMKMDVEGFELQVLEGSESLLATHNVNYVVAECTFGGEPRQRQMLKFMDARGFHISLESFNGPWLDPAAVRNGSSKLPWNNIFCARKQLVDKQPAV
uniref:Methyltransferase FkbM domain-containing protein n=1 Tax=Tetradesmus obliquus TaxID=3088 RepID=A0A383V9J7_TETOB|eukprot:jgi/Sobl393_1/19969/SZX62257.1